MTRQVAAPATWAVRGAAHLAHALVDQVEAVDVRLGEAAARGVDRQPAAQLERAALGEGGALAAPAEAVALQGERDQRGEGVVELGDRDVLRAGCRSAPKSWRAQVQAGPRSGSSHQ